MIGSFRHKGLENLYLAGETRKIGAQLVRKWLRILQLLELAAEPQDVNIAGFRFHSSRGKPSQWSVRLGCRKRFGGES
jgi:proteic killer suppression protein